uniref:Uncharacterized protein n=1 Tax=Picea glauca TaxID=3330 RepID=A0A117NG62_PICGL|nr:hypothetical protein ABT39_MTgene1833 [Picea glauca]
MYIYSRMYRYRSKSYRLLLIITAETGHLHSLLKTDRLSETQDQGLIIWVQKGAPQNQATEWILNQQG